MDFVRIRVSILIILLLFTLTFEIFLITSRDNSYNNRHYIHSPCIPKRILQVMLLESDVKEIPEIISTLIQTWKDMNPEYEHIFFQRSEADVFMKSMGSRINKAYKALKPYAFQCDLLRVCWLHRHGGVYSDVLQRPYVSLDEIIDPTVSFVGICDRKYMQKVGPYVANGFLAAEAGDPLLARIIDIILDNVENRYYGKNALDPTGPGAYGKAVKEFTRMRRMCPGVHYYGCRKMELLGFKGVELWRNTRAVIKNKDKNERFWLPGGNSYNVLYNQKNIYVTSEIIESDKED
jgi:mannosyltransferase OCH1-like enzyme